MDSVRERETLDCKYNQIKAQIGHLKLSSSLDFPSLDLVCFDKKKCLGSEVFESSQYHNLSLHGALLSPLCQFHTVFTNADPHGNKAPEECGCESGTKLK